MESEIKSFGKYLNYIIKSITKYLMPMPYYTLFFHSLTQTATIHIMQLENAQQIYGLAITTEIC